MWQARLQSIDLQLLALVGLLAVLTMMRLMIKCVRAIFSALTIIEFLLQVAT